MFCHFGYFLAIFGKKKLPTLVAYSHSSYGWVKKITSLPPVKIIKIIPTIPFSDIYRVCVLPGQSKFVMVAIRIIIKPLCFSMMNKILSLFACHFGHFFGHFWQKTHQTSLHNIELITYLLRISQIQSVQSILLQRFTFWHGVTTLTGQTVKKVKSSLFCTMNLEKKRKVKKWLYHHSLAHLIKDKIIANTVCLYIYYNLHILVNSLTTTLLLYYIFRPKTGSSVLITPPIYLLL